MSMVTFIERRNAHECGIEIPTNIEYAKRLDSKNGNNSWIKNIEKEMHDAGIVFEVLD